MSQASDFYDWKRHPVTQEVFHQLQTRVDQLKDELVTQAVMGNTTVQAHKAGLIQAFEFLLNIDFEESHGD